jgi:alkanesulfonate monooxygenase SsuD/methylene tetrahydromethanopterin reductase-like flavin-dependent oxidoreductase (luciferase family)
VPLFERTLVGKRSDDGEELLCDDRRQAERHLVDPDRQWPLRGLRFDAGAVEAPQLSLERGRETLERWVAMGSPDEVVRRLRDFAAAGVDTLTIRFPSWDQRRQLRAFLEDVAPRC